MHLDYGPFMGGYILGLRCFLLSGMAGKHSFIYLCYMGVYRTSHGESPLSISPLLIFSDASAERFMNQHNIAGFPETAEFQ